MSKNERRHPQITEPLNTHISPDQLAQLTELRAQLIASDSSLADITDSCLYRFLTQHSSNVAKAHTAFLAYIQWRRDKKVDSILDTPIVNLDVIRACVPYAYHGFDIYHQPIYYEKTGQINCNALADTNLIPVDQFIDSHVWGIEYLLLKCHEKSLELGKRVEYFTSILDMSGLGFQHKNVVSRLKGCLDLDNAYYPQLVGKVYVLNLPWVAPMIYSFVSPFLGAHIKSKLHVVNGDPSAFLRAQIDPAQLPIEYGGRDATTCLAVLDSSMYSGGARKSSIAEDGYDRETVKYEYERILSCDDKGATFSWYFEETSQYDVDFSVQIVESGQTKDSTPKKWAKIQSRCQTSKGSYDSKTATTLIFRWDNSFSWTANKHIKLMTSVVHIDGIEGADQAR